MEKILITGSSDTVWRQIAAVKDECGELKHVTVFFEKSKMAA